MCAPAPEYILDIALFRQRFPFFADAEKWPDAQLQRQYEMACQYIKPTGGQRLKGQGRILAVQYMTAHLAVLEQAALTGQSAGLVASATVDKVSVSLTPPPVKNQREYWYGLTPYGQQLSALLKSKTAGFAFVGGTPAERDAFRKAGGVFVNGEMQS